MSTLKTKDNDIQNIELCSYCGKYIMPGEIFFHWRFITKERIVMHKKCASEFMAHIGSDLIKIKHNKCLEII
jgi:hypothetical protein